MIELHLRDNVRDGFTPSTSPAKREAQIYKEFLNVTGDPMTTSVLMVARDGGSMHREGHLLEARAIIQWISKNLTVEYGSESVGYDTFCGSYCDANLPTQMFIDFSVKRGRNETLDYDMELTYPISRLITFDIPIHLERSFFGVIGSEIVDVEINREAQRMSPYFAYGFGAMFLFVCSTVYFSALYFDRLNW
ncbi:unnamed protein product, partial [Mesorhabditis spiculigera]